MTTMKLEVEKALLAREILNTDNYELLKELSKAYNRIKTRMAKKAAEMEQEPAPDSKEYVLKGLKEAFVELNEIKAGRAKARPIEELIKEVETEEGK